MEAITRADILFEDQQRRNESQQAAKIVVELSLCDNSESFVDEMEESKQFNHELESRLSKHSKVAILKAFML